MFTHFGAHCNKLGRFVVVLTLENPTREAEESARLSAEKAYGAERVYVLSETTLTAKDWEKRVNG